MERWLFCLMCFASAVGTSFLLLFLEQKFHFKRVLINRLHIGWFELVAFLLFFSAAGIAVLANRDLVESPFFLGILLGVFYFLLPTTIV